MELKKIFLLISILVIFVQCDKEDDAVTIHCENLANEVIPAGDFGRIDIPNAFTPNGDGINDNFFPIGINLISISVKIYDANSKIIYQTQTGVPWAPKLSINGSEKFYYRIEGVTFQDRKIGHCGELYALSCYPKGMSQNDFRFRDQYIFGTGFTGVTSEVLVTCN